MRATAGQPNPTPAPPGPGPWARRRPPSAAAHLSCGRRPGCAAPARLLLAAACLRAAGAPALLGGRGCRRGVRGDDLAGLQQLCQHLLGHSCRAVPHHTAAGRATGCTRTSNGAGWAKQRREHLGGGRGAEGAAHEEAADDGRQAAGGDKLGGRAGPARAGRSQDHGSAAQGSSHVGCAPPAVMAAAARCPRLQHRAWCEQGSRRAGVVDTHRRNGQRRARVRAHVAWGGRHAQMCTCMHMRACAGERAARPWPPLAIRRGGALRGPPRRCPSTGARGQMPSSSSTTLQHQPACGSGHARRLAWVSVRVSVRVRVRTARPSQAVTQVVRRRSPGSS